MNEDKGKKKETAVAVIDERYPAVSNPMTCTVIEQVIEGTGITPFQLTQIRLPTGGGLGWTIDLGNGPEAVSEFTGIIGLVKAKQRAWYVEPFGETGGGSPPSCTSSDGKFGFGMNLLDVPGDSSDGGAGVPTVNTCASCEWNQFGSKRGKGKGKDCAEVMHLYIWLPGEALPAVLQVPPTSLRDVQNYIVKLASKFQTVSSVMTKFGLKVRAGKGVPDSSTLDLSIERTLTDAEIENMGVIARKMESLVPVLYPAVSPETAG